MENKLEILLKKLLNKPSRIQIWDEGHNDAVDCYSHGLFIFNLSLNFYSSVKTWSFDKKSYTKEKFDNKKPISLYINIYYFNNKEDYLLQDASFTEIRIKRKGEDIHDFSKEVNKIEKFIRINKGQRIYK